MIIVGTRVSGKCGDLTQNPWRSELRQARDWALGITIKSVENN